MYSRFTIRILPIFTTSSFIIKNNIAYADTQNNELKKQINVYELDRDYIEPISYVKFPTKQDINLEEIKSTDLISAGVRCMLGDSFMCDQPITRVYSYGLYLSNNFKDVDGSFDQTIFNCPEVAKTLRIEVTVTKGCGHWAGGYRKTIGKRMKGMKKYRDDKTVSSEARKATAMFTSQFQDYNLFPAGKIDAGTHIVITWFKGKVTTEINGNVTSEIENDILGEALFRTYYAHNCVNRKVNSKTRCHFREGMSEGELQHQDTLYEKNVCPLYRKCGRGLRFK